MNSSFAHLSLHSEYSIVDGICRLDETLAQAAASGITAVALTDQCNMFAQVKFYKAALKQKIKPILGADVWLQHENDPSQHSLVTLLCQNQIGYHHLTCLISQSYTQGQNLSVPVITRDWFNQSHEGLIVLCGGPKSEIGKAILGNQLEEAKRVIQGFIQRLGNRFYLTVQRIGAEHEALCNRQILQWATLYKCPVVATNQVRFLKSTDFDAHEARVCIHEGNTLADPSRPRHYTAQQYLRSADEMKQLFAEMPGVIENALEIAKRCTVKLQLGRVCLPDFQLPSGQSMESYFQVQASAGLQQRFDKNQCGAPGFSRADYEARLQIELSVINSMGFAGYFMIVADFIQWAKSHAIPVGPGRGSGAGSLVAYALQITDLDPLCYDLLFERFLNPERVSMPDFDIDFCMDKRDLVIDYVTRKYGRDCVSQIITFGTMAAKAVVRDVGRVLGHPYGFVDRIAKLIPFEIGMTLEKALTDEEALQALYDEDEEVRALIDLAKKLEGITRNAGKHAGGVVIAPGKLTDFTPLYCEPDSTHLVSQLDKDDVESVGLVKFDFLGLRTLTIIDWACQTVKSQLNEVIDISTIPLVDPDTFKLLKACATTAVFQLESRGMKDLIKRLQPDCFEDIVALVALFRPGPLQSGMVDDFIDRKHGKQKVVYPHPALEPILKPTYGVILYQEQVMQIAQVLAGYTLGGADLLRRAMGKKKAEEMAEQRAIFTEGAIANGVDERTATYIFDLMEKFAGYGFNKSHSAAYALVAYQTAWLKAHYPAVFMAAVMSADMDNTDKVVRLIEECSQMRLKVLPPDINHSTHHFVRKDADHILYGLGAIKGVGQAAIEGIVAERLANGPYTSLFDFCRRNDLRKVNRRVLDALIKAGSLDELGTHRAALMATLDKAMQLAEQQAKNEAHGQVDMFFTQDEKGEAYLEMPPFADEIRLRYEKETLGLYLTGHPIDHHKAELAKLVSSTINHLRPEDKTIVRVAGLMVSMRSVKTRQGKRMAILSLDDSTARIDVTLFADDFNAYHSLLIKDHLLVVEGTVSHDDFSGELRMRAQKVYTLTQARQHFAKRLVLSIRANAQETSVVPALHDHLSPFIHGSCPVLVDYAHPAANAVLRLGPQWNIIPSDDLIDSLKSLLGKEAVHLDY
jgi:DNA polymerase-3 subunit alpha